MNKIWIISDNPETAFEITGKAKELGGALTVYVLGDETVANQAIGFGTQKVKLMELPLHTLWEQYADLLVKEAEREKPELILVASTCRGKDLAAQLGAKLGCPTVTDSKKLDEKDGKLILQRIIYGGLAYQDLACSTFPVIVTIAPHTFEKGEPMQGTGEKENFPLTGESTVQVVERKTKEASSVNLADADIVVGVGRGLAKQSDVAMFEELAKLLGGEVGCTRPVAEDLNWLPEERYLGITGKQIKPNLYLCAGVSGQIQHVYGIRDSKVIVSIDKNENAPIFKVSDYYIVGDLEEVVPALISAVK